MSYNLENNGAKEKVSFKNFNFEILCGKSTCPFYLWSDANATIGDKEVELYRINVNLSELDYYNLRVDISELVFLAKKDDYIVFKSKNSDIYFVSAMSVNSDVAQDYTLFNHSLKAVNCCVIDNKLSFAVKDTRRYTDFACILDMWVVLPQLPSENLLKEILANICI